MHAECHALFANFASRLTGTGRILEVGSLNVNGSVRPLFQGFDYVGIDVLPGPGVDVVAPDSYRLPFEDESFDTVISASCLEHAKRPWETVLEIDRVLKPGGLVAITTPWRIAYHHPPDYWRLSPDAYEHLFGEWLQEHNRRPYRILQNRLDVIDSYLEAMKP